jgi:hypothetical protein
MNKLIVGDATVQQPYDKYWDEPGQITRRELQRAINKLSANDSELAGMADTAALVLNYILEVKLGIKSREELDLYVEAKKLQMAEAREKLRKAQEQTQEAK